MIKNYLKIALNSLRKNPLYSTVTLFGISFTLMVLIFAVAVLQNELGSHQPMSNAQRLLFLPSLKGEGYERITKNKLDSTLVNGLWKVDTTKVEEINYAKANNTSNSSYSLKLYQDKIKPMKTIERSTAYLPGVFLETWVGDKKLNVNANYVDADFWKIFDFEFLEGKAFSEKTVENRNSELVITEDFAKEYFGTQKPYLGKFFDWGSNGKYKVVGVVATPNASSGVVASDLFIPLKNANSGDLDYDWGHFGSLKIVLLGKSNNSFESMNQELEKVAKTIQPKDELDVFTIRSKSLADMYAWKFIGDMDDNMGKTLLGYISIGLLFFMLIPLLNLIHLNNARVLERAPEIGVRKAFGARVKDVFYQFLFENFIITLLGGFVGVVLSYGLLSLFNQKEWLGKTHLRIDSNVVLYAFLLIVLFSFLSGVLPALRIANFNIVKALKSN